MRLGLLGYAFLIGTVLISSGYRFRCYMFCIDQTAIQNDYIEQRDRCREYAQLKVDVAQRNSQKWDDNARKGNLVSLFSECMAKNGWTVPDGKPADTGKPGSAPPPANPNLPVPDAAAVAAIAAQERASLNRSSECAFARHSAANSTMAASRAKACDLECEQRLRAAPDAPRPAACTAAVSSNKNWGVDKE